ncbi:MAG: hypothetical protein B7Z55_19445 [Planctomycetales bacterium 12-60-4]|nr:MAG: hypothetical protein B7Z55_19445 [Planctomycetales bacterium 12-60-4]
MARSQFENLAVYQLSERLADLLWTIVFNWPPFERRTLGSQVVRAADSIGANIAEGAGRGTYADNRRFVRIARGSLFEVKHWLRRAYRRELLEQAQVIELKSIIDELAPRLNAYLKSIGSSAPNESE